MTTPHRHIVVFGGTFDPIHHGHLRSAIELKELLGADELRLMPRAGGEQPTAPDHGAGGGRG